MPRVVVEEFEGFRSLGIQEFRDKIIKNKIYYGI
jgi:hypothetical protein